MTNKERMDLLDWAECMAAERRRSLANATTDSPFSDENELKVIEAAIEFLNMIPAYYVTYYPHKVGFDEKVHSHSGARSCAARLAKEIGGTIQPVYFGEMQEPTE